MTFFREHLHLLYTTDDVISHQGDSGGPMMCDFSHGTGFQCGITSWGKECAKEPFSGVYTQVSYFNEWIEEVMARNDDSAIS